MASLTRAIYLVSALCCFLAVNARLLRSKRGTRFYRVLCVDSKTSAVRSFGDTWLRWKGQRVEYCYCELGGRERCHAVPVFKCYVASCYNGGTCKEALYSSQYICQCPPGFSGNQCEINTNEKCVVGRGEGYRGTLSSSNTGAECINWNSTSLRGKKFTTRKPDASSLGLGNHNFCRNPDKDISPWCYVYKGTQITWELCSVAKCPEDRNRECVVGSGEDYRGTASVTKSGSSCLPWDSPVLRRRASNAWRPDALQLGLNNHNLCRNPDKEVAPWCYTYKNMQLSWELCDIPKCSQRQTVITTTGLRAPTPNNNNEAKCGQRVDNSLNRPSFRVFGGRDSDIKEQPWQAAINVYQSRHRNHFHLCGGVLIDSCWVLSAAHCFKSSDSPGSLQVVLGRTFRKLNSSGDQIFGVDKYWIHEEFNFETFDNDIAILKLKTDVGICAVNSPEVRPVCLPESRQELQEWTECEISGYGKNSEFSAEYSERVKRGHVRLWPKSRCVTEVLSGPTVTPNMLCAGDTRGLDDACKGDSGGPLVCQTSDRMTLMGLISWGEGCGHKDKPGIYTRVSNYVDWINDKIKANPV